MNLTLSFFDLLMAFKGLSTLKTRNDLIASFCELSSVPMLRNTKNEKIRHLYSAFILTVQRALQHFVGDFARVLIYTRTFRLYVSISKKY